MMNMNISRKRYWSGAISCWAGEPVWRYAMYVYEYTWWRLVCTENVTLQSPAADAHSSGRVGQLAASTSSLIAHLPTLTRDMVVLNPHSQSTLRYLLGGRWCMAANPACIGAVASICRKIWGKSGSVRSSHQTVSDYTVLQSFTNIQQSRFLTDVRRASSLNVHLLQIVGDSKN